MPETLPQKGGAYVRNPSSGEVFPLDDKNAPVQLPIPGVKKEGSPVSIVGLPVVGQVLTAALDNCWTATSFQWVRKTNGVATNIAGQTTNQYTLTAQDVSAVGSIKEITCTVQGLSYAAVGLTVSDGSVAPPVVPPVTPPGQYIAPTHFIVVGDSNGVQALGTVDAVNAPEIQQFKDYFALKNPTAPVINVFSECVWGRPTATAKADWNATIKAKYNPVNGTKVKCPADSRTLVLFCTTSNDVKNLIPYTAAVDSTIATVAADLISMINDCESFGWDWHVYNTSFADTSKTIMENESLGILPVDVKIQNLVKAAKPQKYLNRVLADGTQWLNAYHWVRDHAEYISDGLHYDGDFNRKMMVDFLLTPSYTNTAPPSVQFVSPPADSVGDFAVFSLGAQIEKVISQNAKPLWAGGRVTGNAKHRISGERLPWIARTGTTFGQGDWYGDAGYSLAGYFTSDDLRHTRFVSGTEVAEITIKKLTPSATYELKMAAERPTGDSAGKRGLFTITESGTISLGGSSQFLDATPPNGGVKTPNSITFNLQPSASGTIKFTFSNEDLISNDKRGYLSVFSVKRLS